MLSATYTVYTEHPLRVGLIHAVLTCLVQPSHYKSPYDIRQRPLHAIEILSGKPG